MRATELRISLSAIEENFRKIAEIVGPWVKCMAVVKADAYGHGLVPVARRLEKAGADMFAVAILEEAVQLRDAGVETPILVLGGVNPEDMREAVERNVSMAVYSEDALNALEEAAQALGTVADAHLKIDTGMSRLGVRGNKALKSLLKTWKDCPSVHMQGIFTHFADALGDPIFTRKQETEFLSAIERAQEAGFSPVAHISASDALINPAFRHDMVRPGIALYGYDSQIPGLKIAQKLVTRPVRVDWIRAGESVSYGRTFRSERDAKIMTLPIGYGDGYPRILGNRADVLIRGKRAPIVGRVCMDMLMADITDIPEAGMGDEVVLLGAQGEECIDAAELARHAETIPYEIVLGFSSRVRRVYRDDLGK